MKPSSSAPRINCSRSGSRRNKPVGCLTSYRHVSFSFDLSAGQGRAGQGRAGGRLAQPCAGVRSCLQAMYWHVGASVAHRGHCPALTGKTLADWQMWRTGISGSLRGGISTDAPSPAAPRRYSPARYYPSILHRAVDRLFLPGPVPTETGGSRLR